MRLTEAIVIPPKLWIHGLYAALLGLTAEWLESPSPCHLPRQLDQRAGQTKIVHSLDLSLFLDLQGFTGSL